MMRVVCIGGIFDVSATNRKQIWERFELILNASIPGLTVLTERKRTWLDEAMIRKFADELTERYDDGEELVLIGYSFGGIIACAIARRFKKSRVRVIVSIFSPHNNSSLNSILGEGKEPLGIPVISFAAMFDQLVGWNTRHPESVHHEMLWTDHLVWPFFNESPWQIIAGRLKEFLEK